MPRVWPRSTSKLTPSTAFTVPSSVWKYVRRSLTFKRLPLLCAFDIIEFMTPSPDADGTDLAVSCRLPTAACLLLSGLWIQCVAQTISKKIQTEQHQCHRDARKDQLPWINREVLRAFRCQAAP